VSIHSRRSRRCCSRSLGLHLLRGIPCASLYVFCLLATIAIVSGCSVDGDLNNDWQVAGSANVLLGQEWPQLAVVEAAPIVVNEDGELTEQNVQLHNRTSVPIQLSVDAKSCGCLSSRVPEVVPPHSTGVLVLGTHLPAAAGRKDLTVILVDSSDRRRRVTIRWTVRHQPRILLAPLREVKLDRHSDTVFDARLVTRRRVTEPAGKIEVASKDVALISITQNGEVSDGEWIQVSWELRLIVLGKVPRYESGATRQQLGFSISDGIGKLSAMAWLSRSSSFRDLPEAVLLTQTQSGGNCRKVTIGLTDEVQNVEISTSSGMLELSGQTLDETNKVFVFAIRAIPGSAQAKIGRAVIEIIPNHDRDERVEIPVIVWNRDAQSSMVE